MYLCEISCMVCEYIFGANFARSVYPQKLFLIDAG